MIVLLKYKQRDSLPPYKLEMRYGSLAMVSQSGTIDYDQQEEIEADKVEARIKELKSFSNRKYHSFTV